MAFPNPSDPGPSGPSGPVPPSAPGAPAPAYAPSTVPGAAPPAGPRPFPAGPATTPWTPPPESKPSRTSIYIAIGAVIVALAVILAALFVVGAFSTKSPPTGPMTFKSAEGEVTNYLSSYNGGNWNIVLGTGVAPPIGFSGMINQSLGDLLGRTGCATNWLVANGTSLSAGPVTSDVGQGKASLWLFGAANATGYLLIANVAGHVMPLLALTCSTATGSLYTVPSNAIDSSQAEQAAYGAGEQAFVAAHPGGTALLTITPGLSLGGLVLSSRWNMLYQACAPNPSAPSSVPVPTFNASVNSVTGQVLGHNTSQQPCGGTGILSSIAPPGVPGGGGALSSAFGMGTATLVHAASSSNFPPCLAGDYCYAVPIASASAGLLASDISLTVRTSSSAVYSISSTGGASIIDIAGNPVVVAQVQPGPFAPATWSPGGGQYTSTGIPLESTMTIWVDLGTTDPAAQGLELVAIGNAPYFGEVSVPLP